MELPKRKSTRLQGYNYSTPGAYFITLCTKDRQRILSEISVGTGIPVGTGDCLRRLLPASTRLQNALRFAHLDGPQNKLTKYGEIADRQLKIMSDFYDNIKIDKYVIMPNHIHLLIRIIDTDGQSGTPVPTNSLISQFVSTFKRFCNKEYGKNIWQSRSNDHIVRGKYDYEKIWEYIDTNVIRWEKDCFYDS